MRLTDEDRAIMGPLANAQTISDDPVDVLDGIYRYVRTEMLADLTGSNPIARAKALCAIRRAFENLVGSGYTEFEPLLSELQIGFSRIAQTAGREFVQIVLDPTTSAEDLEESMQCLIGLIKVGAWDFNAASPPIAPTAA